MAPITTPGVLLRSHDYGDTSRILRFYTRDHGLLSVMAKGVRGRTGKGTTALATFASGDLTAYVKPQRDLHTMKDFQCRRLRSGLGGNLLRFAGAAAVAELVVAHADQEPHQELWVAVEEALDRLEEADPELLPTAALAGAWRVVEAYGFAPQLDPCVQCGSVLEEDEVGRFDLAAGGLRCASCSQGASGARLGPGARAQVRALLLGRSEEGVARPRAHLSLLADFVAYHIASRPLKSLRFLGDLLPAETEDP